MLLRDIHAGVSSQVYALGRTLFKAPYNSFSQKPLTRSHTNPILGTDRELGLLSRGATGQVVERTCLY